MIDVIEHKLYAGQMVYTQVQIKGQANILVKPYYNNMTRVCHTNVDSYSKQT